MKKTRNMPARGAKRGGFTLTELVVSATLLVAIMGIVAPLTVQSGRIWRDARRQQMAIDELTNQLERLTALPPQQREQAIADLAPSEYLLAAVPSTVMTAETMRDSDGTRLVLSLSWESDTKPAGPRPPRPPITLVGWLDPMPSQATSEENSP